MIATKWLRAEMWCLTNLPLIPPDLEPDSDEDGDGEVGIGNAPPLNDEQPGLGRGTRVRK